MCRQIGYYFSLIVRLYNCITSVHFPYSSIYHYFLSAPSLQINLIQVDNPESYNFRPKDMLRDLCVIFSSFAKITDYQIHRAKNSYYNAELMNKSVKTCDKLGLLAVPDMIRFASIPGSVGTAAQNVQDDETLLAGALEEFLDPLMCTFMKNPVLLPTSGTIIDRPTIHPFNRNDLTIDMVESATELKQRTAEWVAEKRAASKLQNE